MIYSKTLIKQSDNGIIAHIYEHVIANSISKTLRDEGYYRMLDYTFEANTYDGIVSLYFETRNLALRLRFVKIISSIVFTTSDVLIGIDQIAAEYERTADFQKNHVVRAVKQLGQQEWLTSRQLHITTPIKEEARTLKSRAGGYTRKASGKFKSIDFIYEVQGCPYELKTLAVYVLQALSLNQIDTMYDILKQCYDAGEEWAEYQDLVGYSHTLVLAKDSRYSFTEVEAIYRSGIDNLLNKKLIRRLQRYIYAEASARYPYFSHSSIFAKSYQIMGSSYIKRQANQDNIANILARIKISIAER